MCVSGILGHEFLGVVEAVDQQDEEKFPLGQRVVGEINVVCNDCSVCEAGGVRQRNHCPNRTVLGLIKHDGVFADYLTLPIRNLYPVPDSIPDIRAVFAEPLAAAFRIVEQELIQKDDSVAVVGDGKLGLLIAEALYTTRPRRLVVFGHHRDKLDLLPSGIGKEISDDGTEEKFDSSFDVVVEATGNPAGVMLSSALCRPLGTVVWKTTCAADAKGFNTAHFVVKELRLIGSRCGNFPMALKAMETDVIKPEALVTKVYPFSDALQAIEHAKTRGSLKIQLVMG